MPPHLLITDYWSLMTDRAAGRFPGGDAALQVARRRELRVLRRLHRHGRALAEGAVEHEPLAGRFGEFVQHAAGADVFLQARIGHVQGARDDAVTLALVLLAQVDERDVGLADEREALLGGNRPAAPRDLRLMES